MDISVDKGLGIPALHDELLLASKGGGGEQDELDHSDNTVVLDNLRGRLGLADLLGDRLRWVEKVNLAVYSGLACKLICGVDFIIPSTLELILPPLRPATMGVMRWAR